MRIASLIFFTVISSSACASGGGEAILALFSIQFILFVWPFILAGYYIRPVPGKFKPYITSIIVIYGVIGVVNIPKSIIFQLAPWSGMEGIFAYGFVMTVIVNAVSFILSVLLLRKYYPAILKLASET
ncbi:MAG: hypothetical protein DHS20C09_05400 [marine bacterium B5-7]|nr:MAG: hypothetical protein DHS20C09_05400 [marine bacterium B5-7]